MKPNESSLARAAFDAYKAGRNSIHKNVVDYDWSMVPISLQEVWAQVAKAVIDEYAGIDRDLVVQPAVRLPDLESATQEDPDPKFIWFTRSDHAKALNEYRELREKGYRIVLSGGAGEQNVSWIIMERYK